MYTHNSGSLPMVKLVLIAGGMTTAGIGSTGRETDTR